MIKAVIYARYSSDNQREESIDGQIRECTAYAMRNGFEIVHNYIDRALSARTDNRPQFLEMIKDSSKKLFDVVLVWKLDRFSRDRYDAARYKAALKKNGVKLVSAMENIADTPEGIILESVLEGMAEYYSADLAVKVIRGHTENALKCRSNGGGIAFGLKLEDKKYVPDPLTAPIVLEIYKRYAEGETMQQLVNDLDARGIRGTRGNKISLDVMKRILGNRKYIGEYRYRDIVVANAIEPIVSQTLFDRVQKVREQNKKAPARNKAVDPYLLSGKVFCGRCGSIMSGECGHGKSHAVYLYYKCCKAKKDHTCNKRAVRKDFLESIVIQETMTKLADKRILNAIVEAVMAYQEEENTTVPILEREIKKIEKGINNLLNAIQAGMFHPSMKERMDELEKRKNELEVQLLQEQMARPKYTKEQVIHWLERFRYLDTSSLEQCQWLIRCFVKAIYLYDDKILLSFHYSDDMRTVPLTSAEKAYADSILNSSDMCEVGGPNKWRPH
jgi:DNA invertase Pin-like site-specific DNA recombinase